jgi:hypothetical protein
MATTRPARLVSVRLPAWRARRFAERWLLLGAPIVALLAGLAAEWLDFRALRYPLLLLVGRGVLAPAIALFARERPLRAFALTVLVGAATWGAAETLYAILHLVQGESFDAERFGPQWRQALGLIGVHALFLGVPTGIAAGVLRNVIAARGRT